MEEKISRRDFLKGMGVIAARAVLGLNPFEPVRQPEEEKQLAQIIRRGPSDKPWAALTIDDCWSLEGGKRILEFCGRYKARFTFFPVGRMVEKDPKLWVEVVEAGHELGNHTYGHELLDRENLGEEGIIATIKKANEAIFRATGVAPRFFRPPYMYGFTKLDSYCNWLRGTIFDCGLPFVALWSRDSYTQAIKPGQEAGETEEEIVERIVSVGSSAKNGDIFLMHINKWDLGAIGRIIAGLSERGIRLVTLSELVGIVSSGRNEKRDDIFQRKEKKLI
jgi:peptidoglycan/xylan/chitin deacetylase (PgdA/CDA1 family)